LTGITHPSIVVPMIGDTPASSSLEAELKGLEQRIDELIRACEELKAENRSLRTQRDALLSERAGLVEKTDIARTRVEAMIDRLKSMEHGA
jgi:cell division protein ZapB